MASPIADMTHRNKVQWLLASVLLGTGRLSAQLPVSIFGANTPAIADGGDPQPIVLGVRIFADVPGQVLGCSFYKAATNVGVHVVSLWDSVGKLLATQVATGETVSGKQLVLFGSPVSIAANQIFTCGYFAPAGHFSNDRNVFTAQKTVSPLHVPIDGGVFSYSTQATHWPASTWASSNYWVDVLFIPDGASLTWIRSVAVTTTASTANITWTSAVPSDSQVEYGPTTAYNNVSVLEETKVTAHAVTVNDLPPGTTYHFRVGGRDSESVLVVSVDHTLVTTPPLVISISPARATITSGDTQQLIGTVTGTSNVAVTWWTSAGTISASGLFKSPEVVSQTSILVTATSQADNSRQAFATLTVNPAVSALTVNPASLSFAGQTGGSMLQPASVSVTGTGAGSLMFTGTSDRSWLVLSASSGTVPSVLQVSPNIQGLPAGMYNGNIVLNGGGITKTVAVSLQVTSPPIQHSVALSWQANTNPHVVSYRLYRSTLSGLSYSLSASAIGRPIFIDQTVQSGATYYYVVTAIDDQGQESAYSNQAVATIP
ncbi:MAG: DUF4082 domain-containing protein [Terriglobales bacterium]